MALTVSSILELVDMGTADGIWFDATGFLVVSVCECRRK